MRLLVAVSNEPLAHAIHGALLAGRHEVSLASTGSIALAAVAKESFDAVILDESLGERCLTSTPLSKRRPTAPSARIHAQTTQMPKPNNARTMPTLAHKLTHDTRMSC